MGLSRASRRVNFDSWSLTPYASAYYKVKALVKKNAKKRAMAAMRKVWARPRGPRMRWSLERGLIRRHKKYGY